MSIRQNNMTNNTGRIESQIAGATEVAYASSRTTGKQTYHNLWYTFLTDQEEMVVGAKQEMEQMASHPNTK